MYQTEQEIFWAETYRDEYIQKNIAFDENLGIEAWKIMLTKAKNITNFLECGCNIGRNLNFLKNLLPNAQRSIIEISKPAFEYVTKNYELAHQFNGSILTSNFPKETFDLVYTMGVLIHIHPDDLLVNMDKMYEYSNRYILMGEYFNRTPVMIDYQGKKDKLFKRDFGKLFIENHNVRLVDYGFLWGHLYDIAGFDDVTWWLFEKQ